MSCFNGGNKQQSLTISKNDIVNAESPILTFTRTKTNIYVSTKSRKTIRYDFLKKDNACMNNPNNEYMIRLGHINIYNNLTILIMMTNSNVYAIEERQFGRTPSTRIIDKSYKYFAILPQSSYIVFFDNQNLTLYSVVIDGKDINATISKQIPHQMKGAFDILATSSLILIYDKKNYKIYNSSLTLITTEQIQRPFRCVAAINGYNAFVAVQENNLVSLANAKDIILEEIKFPEDVIALQVKPPYVYALSQKSIMYFLTVASLKDTIVTLPFKTKNPILDVFDDYSAIFSNDSQLYPVKCNFENDINCLKMEEKWDRVIKMYELMDCMMFDLRIESLCGEIANFYLNKKKFDLAFEAFKKSKQHPFDLISKFSLVNSELKYSAKKDCEKHLKTLNDLYEVITTVPQADDRTIKNAIQDLCKQTQVKDIPATSSDLVQYVLGEIEAAKQVEREIKEKLPDNAKKLADETSAFPNLLKYIGNIVKIETQSTRIKIYNTLLAEIYSKAAILQLPDFIKEERPLFFNIVSKALQNSNDYESLQLLCEQYSEHTLAIQFLKEANSYERLIDYVSNSKDWLSLASNEIQSVFEYYKCQRLSNSECAKKAAKLFFSRHISTKPSSRDGKTDIDRVCEIIDSMTSIGKAQNEMKTLIDKAQNDMKTLIDKAQNEMKTSIDKALNGMKTSIDKASNDMKTSIDKASNDMKTSIDKANNDMKTLIDKAKNDMKTSIGTPINDMKIAFLYFCVFSLHVKIPSVHSLLINLCIDKLKSYFAIREGRRYIAIANENDSETRQTREALLNLLNQSDYYEPSEVIQKIPESFLEEKLSALLKINTSESIEKCIELVVSKQVKFNIALKFCEEAYDKNDQNRGDVYNKLFFRLQQSINSQKNTNERDQHLSSINSQMNTNERDQLLSSIKELLNTKAEYLNPVLIIENIPKEITLSDLQGFFNCVTARIAKD